MKISKQVKELLTKGTAKQKAVLICKEYIDKTTLKMEPLLTDEEANAIKDSLNTANDVTEFNKWISLYNASTRISPSLALTHAEYRGQANKLLAYVQMWEDYTNEENHLNALYEDIKETGCQKAIDAFHNSVKYISLEFAEVKVDEDGYIVIDLGDESDEFGFYRTIKRLRKEVEDALEIYKAGIVAIEEWIKKRRCAAIIPDLLKQSLKEGKEDYALQIAPQYSKAELNKRIARGETVTAYERLRAIFPDYNEIRTNEMYLDIFRNKIAAIERSEKE